MTSPATAEDVHQTVFLRLVEHLHRIEDPERLGSWLATTARREAWRVAGAERRFAPPVEPEPGNDEDPAERFHLAQRRLAVRRAVERLPERCRLLLRMLMTGNTYEDVASALQIAKGGIGPTRERCLKLLRQDPEVRRFDDA